MMSDAKIESVRSSILAGLPARTRWTIVGSSEDFDFSDARKPLRRFSIGDFNGVGGMREEWAGHLIFGTSDYDEGGGAFKFLTIREADGCACCLDVEIEDSVRVYNSSVERFIRAFALFDKSLGRGRALPPDIVDRVRGVDPECYPDSYWRLLIEYILDP